MSWSFNVGALPWLKLKVKILKLIKWRKLKQWYFNTISHYCRVFTYFEVIFKKKQFLFYVLRYIFFTFVQEMAQLLWCSTFDVTFSVPSRKKMAHFFVDVAFFVTLVFLVSCHEKRCYIFCADEWSMLHFLCRRMVDVTFFVPLVFTIETMLHFLWNWEKDVTFFVSLVFTIEKMLHFLWSWEK